MNIYQVNKDVTNVSWSYLNITADIVNLLNNKLAVTEVMLLFT